MPQSGWVKTRLMAGDELGSTAVRKVAPQHDLAALYGVTAKQIVAGNDVAFNAEAINSWVMRTGGTKLSTGQVAFSDNSVIYLPPGGPRPVAGGPVVSTPVQGASVAGRWATVAVIAGLGWLLWPKKRKSKAASGE